MTSIAHRQRRNAAGEEDAGQLRLGREFEEAGALSVSEVKVLMDNQVATREHPSDTQVFKKTYDYVNSFARFSDSERVFAVRVVLSADPDLKAFETGQLINLCPETAEEAKAWIPSLNRKDDDQLQGILNGIINLREYKA